jgi:hypothetical protein
MSRGLGSLQREILAALMARKGGDRVFSYGWGAVWLAEDVHDLRAVIREMAKTTGRTYGAGFVCNRFAAASSRAIAGLVRRDLIEPLSLVPVISRSEDCRLHIHHLADGHFIEWKSHQRRFVRVMRNVLTLRDAA